MATNLRGDAAEAAQQFLDEAIKEADQARVSYVKHAQWRYYLALLLKAIALFGGLVVASFSFNRVALGVIISAAILIDQLFSNYKRMMTDTIAGDAVERTIRRVRDNYNDQVLDVINANQQGDAARARGLLLTLARESAKTVRQEMDRIKDAVSHANIQFLSALNLDQPAKTELPHAPGSAAVPSPAVAPPETKHPTGTS